MSDTVIQIEGLWKEYRLGVIGHGTLTRDLQSWWAKVRGKEDPNSKLQPMLAGQEKQIEGDRFWALRDINLEVKEGEILGIIGRNGAGKSTLLKLLSRVTAPTKGQIKIKGRIASLLEVGTGFHPELTGRENIFMNGAILGMSKQEIKSNLDEIIDFSGVEKFIDTPVKRYSSGMYVRLAFAVAAHLEPEILVVDEVLAVGDAEFQQKAMGKMSELSSREGRTVLVVSHNMKSIEYLCPSAFFVKNGSIDFKGITSAVIFRYINQNNCNQNPKWISSTRDDIHFENFSIETVNGKIEHGKEIVFNFIVSAEFDCIIDIRIPVENRVGSRVATVRREISVCKGKSEIKITTNEQYLCLGSYTVSFNVKMINKLIVNHKDVAQFSIVGGKDLEYHDFMIERLGLLGNIFRSKSIVKQLN
ncbi:MAG: ABC transporter ATP-binding protein [Candidatus Electronema sp. VV]